MSKKKNIETSPMDTPGQKAGKKAGAPKAAFAEDTPKLVEASVKPAAKKSKTVVATTASTKPAKATKSKSPDPKDASAPAKPAAERATKTASKTKKQFAENPTIDVPAAKHIDEIAEPLPIPYEEVARLAYSYAEARGFVGGSAEEDWFRAEQELRHIRGH